MLQLLAQARPGSRTESPVGQHRRTGSRLLGFYGRMVRPSSLGHLASLRERSKSLGGDLDVAAAMDRNDSRSQPPSPSTRQAGRCRPKSV